MLIFQVKPGHNNSSEVAFVKGSDVWGLHKNMKTEHSSQPGGDGWLDYKKEFANNEIYCPDFDDLLARFFCVKIQQAHF